MKIQLNENYQSMTVRLIPGIHEVPDQLGKYLIDNGYASDAPIEISAPNGEYLMGVDWSAETTSDEKANLLAQFDAAVSLFEGKTPDVPLGEGLSLTDNERSILGATGHPVAPKADDDKSEEPAHTGDNDPAGEPAPAPSSNDDKPEEPAPTPTGNDGAPKSKGKQK